MLVKCPEFAADLAIAVAQKNKGRADPLRKSRSNFKETFQGDSLEEDSCESEDSDSPTDSDSSDSDDSGEETRPSKRAKRA